MTEPRSNVIPFVDFRERWPIDFKAATSDAPDAPAPKPLPDFIRREVDAFEREQLRIHRFKLTVWSIIIVVLLGAYALAFRAAYVALSAPPASAATPLEHPLNP